MVGERDCVDLVEVGADLVGHAGADGERRDRPIEHPLLGIRRLERLGEQLLEIHDLDAAVAHQVRERVVLLARSPDPQHVVEQELVVVVGGQALELEIRPVDHHPSQLADLGMDAELPCGRGRGLGLGWDDGSHLGSS